MGEITYPFRNFNGVTVEVMEWMSNFIPHLIGHVITYPCWDWVSERGPWTLEIGVKQLFLLRPIYGTRISRVKV